MKKGMVLILSILSFVACKNTGENTAESSNTTLQVGEQQVDQTPKIGGEKNEHGCLVAAGETWSELKQKCLRLFEEGIRLNPVQKDGSAVVSAFVLFNDDQSKVEVFLPKENSKALILDKKDTDVYGDSTYCFNAKEGALYVNNDKQYTK